MKLPEWLGRPGSANYNKAMPDEALFIDINGGAKIMEITLRTDEAKNPYDC